MNDILKLFKWYSNERKAVGSGHVRKDRAHRFFVRVVFVLFETRRFCKVERFVFPDLYPAEIIPVRLSEIYRINEAYEWVCTTVKEQLKKDFQGQEEDIANMQQVIDSGSIGAKKKEVWLSLGITLCVILANEVDGLEWRTLIDGNREAPVLTSVAGNTVIDPMKLVWSKVKAGEPCNLAEVYRNLLS